MPRLKTTVNPTTPALDPPPALTTGSCATLTFTELSHRPDATGYRILDRNLDALRRADPSGRAAGLVQSAAARADVAWIDTPVRAADGTPLPTGTITEWTATGAVARSLASRRDPLAEAARLADEVKASEAGAIVVVGFGLGYHVAELARRVRNNSIIMLFEPDVGLMRAALERIDLSDALAQCVLRLFTDADDDAGMTAATQGIEGLLALGTVVVEHPASGPRLGTQGKAFLDRFTGVMMAVRTAVVTTMVQTEATLRNLTQNIDHYAAGAGVAELAGVLSGRPAIVVSAGPSLARNVDLLARPGVRERFAIIATQTVLKPLLARGIRPHLVVALDHHEISARFYEGLTAAAVEGITLVIEPKVNPAVPGAFPGMIRCAADDFLDTVLGPDLARTMGRLPPGATVAHLAYSLARHLACDPVVLIGQDLGFTDGQYYAAGAAIHDVWAGELNDFNTLEMLEWQRIVRMRPHLRAATDAYGRPIYTDEQMAAYLLQFQALFQADAERGLLTIDATEGGVAKAATIARPLAETLDLLGGGTGPTVAELLPAASASGADRRARVRLVIERVREVRRGVWQVAACCREARGLLAQMLEHHADQSRVNRLIGQAEAVRDRVSAIQPAFRLVEWLNQTGVFNRYRADRRINLTDDLPPLERQRAQIERDLKNVHWLGDAADALGDMLDRACQACAGGARITRTPTRVESPADTPAGEHTAPPLRTGTQRLPALIAVDADVCGLGLARDLSTPLADGRNALQLTLARLARCARVSEAVLLSGDIARTRAIVGTPPAGLVVRHVQARAGELGVPMPRSLRATRLAAAHCWRGGLGNLSVYDEVLAPGPALAALGPGQSAALVVGADWALVDPHLCDAAIDRYAESPEAHRLVFTQAAPGLAGCVIDRELLGQIAGKRADVGAFASIGGVLAYVPTAPTPDLLAKSMCLPVPPAVRDCALRCAFDTRAAAATLLGAVRAAGLDPLTADAAAVAAALAGLLTTPAAPGSRTVPGRTLELSLLDAGGGCLRVDAAARALGALGNSAAVTVVALTAAPGRDALDHPEYAAIARMALEAEAGCLHIRTPVRGSGAIGTLTRGPLPDVISVECAPEAGPVVSPAVGELLAWRATLGPSPDGLPHPWIVPRLVRRDAAYAHVEGWYDRNLLTCGWAVIDPLPEPEPGARIAPLPLPALAARRRALLHAALGSGAGGVG